MKESSFLDELTQKLCNALPDNFQKLEKDLKKNFQVILQSALNKLDIVAREEFDAQTKVLARTRKKIEDLEKQLKELEKLILIKKKKTK